MKTTIAKHENKLSDLTEGSIIDKVLLFAVPLMPTSMLQQLFTGFRIYHTWLSLLLIFPVSRAVNAAFIMIGYPQTRNHMLPAE